MKKLSVFLAMTLLSFANAQEHGDGGTLGSLRSSNQKPDSFDWKLLGPELKKAFASTNIPGMNTCVQAICGDAKNVLASSEGLKRRDISYADLVDKFKPLFLDFYRAQKKYLLQDYVDYDSSLRLFDQNTEAPLRAFGNMAYIWALDSDDVVLSEASVQDDGQFHISVDKEKTKQKLPSGLSEEEKTAAVEAIAEIYESPEMKSFLYFYSLPFELAFSEKRPGKNYTDYYEEKRKEYEAALVELKKVYPAKVFKNLETSKLRVTPETTQEELIDLEENSATHELMIRVLKHPETLPKLYAWKGFSKDYFSQRENIRAVRKKEAKISEINVEEVSAAVKSDFIDVYNKRIEEYKKHESDDNFNVRAVHETLAEGLSLRRQVISHLIDAKEAIEASPSSSEIAALKDKAEAWTNQTVNALSSRLSKETAASAFSKKRNLIWPETNEAMEKRLEVKIKNMTESANEKIEESSDVDKKRMAYVVLASALGAAESKLDWRLSTELRSFGYTGLNDAYFRVGDGGIRVSPYVLAHPDLGEGILKHESGHSLQHALQKSKMSEHSAGILRKTFACMKEKHGPFDVAEKLLLSQDKSVPEIEDASAYNSEDFADYISAISSGKETPNFACALLRQDEDKYDPGALYVEKDSDEHSPALFRLLQIESQIRGRLPESCRAALISNSIALDTRDCMAPQ